MNNEKEIILKVENISKQYRLGLVGTGTLSDDLKRWWHLVRGKEDPFLKIGDTNDRSTKGESNYVWSLKNISFDVYEGDVIGVIGKNGAGKSTLLKILSRVTSPTTGTIKSNGRIASLLEVGTGFHPELTGKENIYLNGAILGMTKKEIASKLDEIIEFSGCERYIDTPTKRYSSGMTVRLAFAVAAFLEPDILIVDEVLAVGDAEFQKKAIGKMKDISTGDNGRTVLFVSHNMAAVENLCKKSILLQNGEVIMTGDTNNVIAHYLSTQNHQLIKLSEVKSRQGNSTLRFTDGLIEGVNTTNNLIETFKEVRLKLDYTLNVENVLNFRIDVGINNYLGDRIAWISTDTIPEDFDIKNNKISFIISQLPLAPGDYTCNIFCEINNEIADWLSGVLPFSVAEKDYYNSGKVVPSNQGSILLDYKISQ
ncbi:ATP-binding cassette domain-containing protein [Vicingus serpentipes]|uniref:ATP-binding cassette domain-containing protein n=1 Tax=Vicingus serpentipes TaxID=1926625 RepID=A0A5C6RTT3_9FLAO|nr:ABC transporter ATP-binding protein [Vicingus serpentipes]TXB65419.1 ATP-binding cassette domain-containing protein [Vicingus serpentipes]